jgi:hypothetical protein
VVPDDDVGGDQGRAPVIDVVQDGHAGPCTGGQPLAHLPGGVPPPDVRMQCHRDAELVGRKPAAEVLRRSSAIRLMTSKSRVAAVTLWTTPSTLRPRVR